MPGEWSGGDYGNAPYVKIHPYFFNIGRRIGGLLRLLYTKSAPLGIIDPKTPLVALRIRSSAIYILTSIGVKCCAAKTKVYLGRKPEFASLPDCGDIAMFCFPNCMRMFDLSGARITNICILEEPDVRLKLIEMVDKQTKLGEMGVAPRIYERDNEGHSYVEELCEGTRLKNRAWWRREVFKEVSDKARTIQRSSPEVSRSVKDVADELRACIEQLPEIYFEKTSDDWLTDEAEVVCNDVNLCQEVGSALSHGDLACRNVLVRPDESIVFIDWQTLDFRVKDYDIYNYHFSIAQNGAEDRLPENTVFEYLNENLKLEDKDAALKGLAEFKLEFLATRLKYFVLCSDMEMDSTRISRVLVQIRNYVSCFRRYGEYCDASM